jgi:hypothetical protein
MTDDYKKRLTGILEDTVLTEEQKAKLEEIFPALHQSEDERISKTIIRVIKELAQGYDNVAAGLSVQDAVAWLEKKGAQGSGKEVPFSEWSDKDHEMVFCIRKIIEKCAFSQSAVDVNGDLCEKEYIDADDWMESVEGRLMQVPKQEWSAEDEEIKNIFVGALDLLWEKYICFDHKSKSECLSWIRSIENRIVGKPKHDWASRMRKRLLMLM